MILSLSLEELEQRAKNRGIKDYKSLSIDKLLSILNESEQVKRTKTVRDIRKEKFDSDKILRVTRTFHESEEDDYETVRISNAFDNNYIEYESNRDKDKTLSIKEHRDMIKQYLSDTINDHKTQDEWKIQLTMVSNFISSKDSEDSKNLNETFTMHTTSDNIEIMIGNETDEIVRELFESPLQKYPKGLEKSMKRSKFVFDSVDLLYYKLHRTILNGGISHIDSPEWLKNKKSIINLKNSDDKCFQYAVTVALNYKQIEKDPQRIKQIKPFIDQYNWKEIKFPLHKNGMNLIKIIKQVILTSCVFLIILKK